ncbi:MAG: hypothetical protein J5J04_16610 [Anaerolineae bacterium]|nr:hypothetical protein [Anaerolineae bacterium]
MTKFAKQTTVAPEKSRAEIERLLVRYGASQFMYAIKPEAAAIAFVCHGRNVRFLLPFPRADEKRFTHTTRTRGWAREVARTEIQARTAYDQEIRSRWRALALVIKAKLEAVESGIAEFEDEFMAHIVLPGGKTMSEHARPLIAQAYETGHVPPLLGFDG